MKIVMTKEDLIREYKDKLGMVVSFDEVVFPNKEKTILEINKELLSEREIRVYENILPNVNVSKNIYTVEVLEQEVEEYSKHLYEVLQEGIRDFVKVEGNGILGKTTYTKLGIIGIYKTESGIIYDILTENNDKLSKEIKSNKQKLIKLFNEKLDLNIKEIDVFRENQRVQLHLIRDVIKYNKTFFDSMVNVFKNKKIKSDNILLSLGEDSKGELRLVDIENEASSIAILGGSGSGKTWKLVDMLSSINVLSPENKVEYIIFDPKTTPVLEQFATLYETDLDNYKEFLENVLNDMRQRDSENKKYKVKNIKDLNKDYVHKVVVLDEMTMTMGELSKKGTRVYDRIRELLVEISSICGVGYTLIYTGQRAIDSSFPKTLLENTKIKIVGKTTNIVDYSTMLGTAVNNKYIQNNVSQNRFYVSGLKDSEGVFLETYRISNNQSEINKKIRNILS